VIHDSSPSGHRPTFRGVRIARIVRYPTVIDRVTVVIIVLGRRGGCRPTCGRTPPRATLFLWFVIDFGPPNLASDFHRFLHLRLATNLRFGLASRVNSRVTSRLTSRVTSGLTTADAGSDADNNDIVDLNPQGTGGDGGVIERNPNYNLVLDAVGRRMRLENALSLNWNVGLAIQF
jgi:hypothetical protein